MNQKQIAEALGVTPSAVTKWAQRGCPMHSVEAVRAWRAAHMRPRMRPAPPDGTEGPLGAVPEAARGYWDSRARRERAEAAMAEHRLALEAAELVDRAALERALAAVLRRLRARLLALPQAVVPALAGDLSAAAMDARLRAAITAALVDAVQGEADGTGA
jgi:hypothetical protein